MVPTRTRIPGKTGEHLPVREKSGNFTQNTEKIRKNYTGKLKKKILESWGNLSASYSENPTNIVQYIKLKRTLKSTGKL